MKNELTHVWSRTLDFLEQQLPKPNFEIWLKNTKPVALYQDTMIVGVQNEFARDRLESRYAPLLRQALKDITGRYISLKFVVPSVQEEFNPTREEVAATVSATPSFQDFQFKPLNPKYTFETFVIGNSNRFAHAASLAVAENPARSYNPLFIYGGVGLGKTHLMHAIGHHLLHQNNRARIAYVTSETFTNEFINSIRDEKTVDFQNRYRNVDILLIDDIQFLAGKERTQEEFYHTFNAIHEANKQIVISSDSPPKEIPTLEERLRSRFEWGLICDIQPPDLETRIAILRKKAQIEGLQVPDDVISYIAARIETNIRELEGALTRVVAHASITRDPITLNQAVEALKDILPASRTKQITIELIQQAVAEFYSLKIDDFKVRKRTRAVAFPRQVAMYLCRELTDCSLPKIGEEFGGRDHTTVLHACEKIADDLMNDPSLQNVIEQITNRVKSE